MADKGKAIKGLECCKPAWFTVTNCANEYCPYNCYGHNEITGCVDHLIDDALELLKEQEAKRVKTDMYGHAYCPQCSTDTSIAVGLRRMHRDTRFCPYCGQEVKWE